MQMHPIFTRCDRKFAVCATIGFTLLQPACARAQNAPAVEQVAVLRVPEGGLQPQVAVSGATTHLLYYKGDPKGGDVFYVRSTDGGKTYSALLRVNSQPGSAVAAGTIRGAQLAVGKNGRLHVVWFGSAKAEPRAAEGAPLLYSRLNTEGTAFEPQRNLMTRTFHLDGGPSLAADEEGRVYVVWHANAAKEEKEAQRLMWIARSADDGQTFTPEAPMWNEPTGVCACCQVKVWADNGGKVKVLYRSAFEVMNRDTYLLTSSDAGQTFRGIKAHPWKIGACPMSSYAFARRGAELLAAWESAEQIYWAPVSDDGALGAITAAPESAKNRKHPVLATNVRGDMMMAWTEGTGWARGGKVRWQLSDAKGQTLSGGSLDGLPAWSMAAVFARPDGSFALLY